MIVNLEEKESRAGRRFGRIPTAAQEVDVSDDFIKKLLRDGRLTRFKLGTVTLIDLQELRELVQPEGR